MTDPGEEDAVVYTTQEAILADVLPDMQPGDCVYVHEPDCDLGEEECLCAVIIVRGPSGKA